MGRNIISDCPHTSIVAFNDLLPRLRRNLIAGVESTLLMF
jgi:hypothetical protein